MGNSYYYGEEGFPVEVSRTLDSDGYEVWRVEESKLYHGEYNDDFIELAKLGSNVVNSNMDEEDKFRELGYLSDRLLSNAKFSTKPKDDTFIFTINDETLFTAFEFIRQVMRLEETAFFATNLKPLSAKVGALLADEGFQQLIEDSNRFYSAIRWEVRISPDLGLQYKRYDRFCNLGFNHFDIILRFRDYIREVHHKNTPSFTATPKYALTREVITVADTRVTRIVAVRDFGEIKRGTLGGFIESEENLSHEGNCWIGDQAIVYDEARVTENAIIKGRARVFQEAHVYGNALVDGTSRVHEWAKVYENAHIKGCAFNNIKYGKEDDAGFADIGGEAHIHGNAYVSGNTSVYDMAEVFGDAILKDSPEVFEFTKVSGNATISGQASVRGDSQVNGRAIVTDKAIVSNYAEVTGDAVIKGESKVYQFTKVEGNSIIVDREITGNVVIRDNSVVDGDYDFRDWGYENEYKKRGITIREERDKYDKLRDGQLSYDSDDEDDF
jgi:carbonic anhydrase/acetyltransferase-like protein (isoleucine patch superfamily)